MEEWQRLSLRLWYAFTGSSSKLSSRLGCCVKVKGAWVVCCESRRACEEADKGSTDGILWDQCSRLKPSYEFHFEGFSNFSPSVEGLVQIQDVNARIEKWNTKLVLNLCMNYMLHVSSTMWRIKNQPSNSTSCSDNALRLLVLVLGTLNWGLQVMSSFSIWGCILKGYFEREIFWRAKSRLKGIEDFNLKHCMGSMNGENRLLVTYDPVEFEE